MRRWLAVLLLMLLPLQFSWAAVASYCQHDADATPRHLGHHEHQHQGSSPDAADSSDAPDAPDASPGDAAKAGADSKLPGAHTDCGYCHVSLAKTLTTTASHLPMLSTEARPRVDIASITSALFERIERPNWHRA